jgi:hypothetical protein
MSIPGSVRRFCRFNDRGKSLPDRALPQPRAGYCGVKLRSRAMAVPGLTGCWWISCNCRAETDARALLLTGPGGSYGWHIFRTMIVAKFVSIDINVVRQASRARDLRVFRAGNGQPSCWHEWIARVKAWHSLARLAVQRRSHGDGLRAPVLHSRRRRHQLRVQSLILESLITNRRITNRGSLDPTIPRSQDARIPGSQDPRMHGSQDPRIPGSTD